MLQKFKFPFGLSVNWSRPDQFLPLDANMHSWLLDTGSLTERLQSLCEEFSVEVLGQAVLQLDATEQSALNKHCTQVEYDAMNEASSTLWQIREVLLYGDGKPWVFARSALPDHMCRSTWANLGNQPLGQRIFNDPSFVRSDFEIGHLQTHPASQIVGNNSAVSDFNVKQRWARRSVFTINNDTLLVAEAFLPDCPCYVES